MAPKKEAAAGKAPPKKGRKGEKKGDGKKRKQKKVAGVGGQLSHPFCGRLGRPQVPGFVAEKQLRGGELWAGLLVGGPAAGAGRTHCALSPRPRRGLTAVHCNCHCACASCVQVETYKLYIFKVREGKGGAGFLLDLCNRLAHALLLAGAPAAAPHAVSRKLPVFFFDTE